MIDYFEAGNKDTDATAKAILESNFEYKKKQWKAEIKRIKNGKNRPG